MTRINEKKSLNTHEWHELTRKIILVKIREISGQKKSGISGQEVIDKQYQIEYS